MAPLPVPWDPRAPLVLAGSEVRATPTLYGFFPRGVHETPRERMHPHRPLAWAEVDAPRLACLARAPGCRPQPAMVLCPLQPLSQPESPAPGPPGHMDLEPPPQPLFGTPASQPKKEPPGYEEAVSQQPRRQVKRVAGGPRSGWLQSPGSCGSGAGWLEPAFWVQEALERGCRARREGGLQEPGRSPLGPDCWLRAGRVCALSPAGAPCCRSSSFSGLWPTGKWLLEPADG